MSADAERWNTRYRESDCHHPPQACAVLSDYRYLLPASGYALDVACGRGGNALLLAEQGLTTSAWDYADEAINKLDRLARDMNLSIDTRVRDVVCQPPMEATFDVIVVCHFLDRDLAEPLVTGLKPGGLLFYQTFITDKVTDHGPSNPAYRLTPNELLRLFAPLQVIHYHEAGCLGDTSQGFRDQAQFIGCKPE